MNSFSFVYLAAIAAIIASTNGVQADTPVAGVNNEPLAETKERSAVWDCYYDDKFVGTVTVSDTPPRSGDHGARSGGVLASSDQAVRICNSSFGECNSSCSAR
jgi:hypothetical protein